MVQQCFIQSLAPTTIRSYHSAHIRYINFCITFNLSPIPVTQSTLCRFVALLAQEGVAHKTLKAYLSAVRYLHLPISGTDPGIRDMTLLSYVMQGIRRGQAAANTNRPRPRLPITAEILRSLKLSWEASGISFDTRMLWAVSCTCFFGFLRSGEATVPTQSSYDAAVHLSISDVSLTSAADPEAIVVRIKASKTDPFRNGTSIYLGRTGRDLCPVAALLGYITHRGMSPGPRFRFESGQPLTRDALVREIRLALGRVGMDATQYSGHSFRIGAATSAAAAGIDDAVIKTLGRWRSTAYQSYIQLPRESLASISSSLARQ